MTNSPQSFELTGILMLLAIVALFGGLIFWFMRREKKKKEAEQQVLASLGFSRVIQPGADIFEHLETLYRRNPRQRFKLRELYERRMEDGKYLVFDLVETSGEDNTYLGSNAIAVLSPALHLPRANIMGRMAIEEGSASWMVKAAGKMLDWAINLSHLNRLSFEDSPEIENKLVVMAEDEIDTRAFFTEERLRQLTWLAEPTRLSAVECSGDLLILKRQASQTRQETENELPDLLRDARLVWMALV